MDTIQYPGYIIKNTTIAVDYWPTENNNLITHYFLTHAHGTHTKGLNSNWSNGTIYCSELTKKLLIFFENINDKYIRALKTGKIHTLQLNDEQTFNVQLIDANHCPGSVIFLFTGNFGNFLSTGDFRYNPQMFCDRDSTLRSLKNSIDICYLDNTHNSKVYQNIPERDIAINEIRNLIQTERKKSHQHFIIKQEQISKEDILIKLAEHFKTQIYVASNKRFQLYLNVLKLNKKYFTMAKPFNKLCIEVQDYNDDTSIKEAFYIYPTAFIRKCNRKSNVYYVPYTNHSSFSELCEFVKCLRPKSIIGTVKNPASDTIIDDMSILNSLINDFDQIKKDKRSSMIETSSGFNTSELNTLNFDISSISENDIDDDNESIIIQNTLFTKDNEKTQDDDDDNDDASSVYSTIPEYDDAQLFRIGFNYLINNDPIFDRDKALTDLHVQINKMNQMEN